MSFSMFISVSGKTDSWGKAPRGRKLEMKQMFALLTMDFTVIPPPHPLPLLKKKFSWREKKMLVNKISL